MSGYMLVRVKRQWVPWWLWKMATRLPRSLHGWMAPLLSEHVDDQCQCPCHDTPGMRDCGFCR